MARNRKYRSAATRFGPALKAFLFCLLIGGSGVGYVWQKNQIYQLGQQYNRREARRAELASQNEKLRTQLAKMQTLKALEKRINDLKLGLGPPQQSQIWRLDEPSREGPKPAPERPYLAMERANK